MWRAHRFDTRHDVHHTEHVGATARTLEGRRIGLQSTGSVAIIITVFVLINFYAAFQDLAMHATLAGGEGLDEKKTKDEGENTDNGKSALFPKPMKRSRDRQGTSIKPRSPWHGPLSTDTRTLHHAHTSRIWPHPCVTHHFGTFLDNLPSQIIFRVRTSCPV